MKDEVPSTNVGVRAAQVNRLEPRLRTAFIIVLGALAIGAVALWNLTDPPPKSCTVWRSASANAPGGRYVAHVETRTCDAGLRAGSFVMLEKSTEPGTMHEAFYSSRNLRGIALQWLGDRELEIAISEPLDSVERSYDAQSVASVAVTLKEASEHRGRGP